MKDIGRGDVARGTTQQYPRVKDIEVLQTLLTTIDVMTTIASALLYGDGTDDDDGDLIFETLVILLEPTIYLTGNTPVTMTEMMMSQLPEDICTSEIAQELLDFALLLGTDGYTPEQGADMYRHLEKDFLLTTNEVHKYTNVAISVRSFMDVHNGGHYSTLA